jgi:hypothetical protein
MAVTGDTIFPVAISSSLNNLLRESSACPKKQCFIRGMVVIQVSGVPENSSNPF